MQWINMTFVLFFFLFFKLLLLNVDIYIYGHAIIYNLVILRTQSFVVVYFQLQVRQEFAVLNWA